MKLFKVGKHPQKSNRFCILQKTGPGRWVALKKAFNTRQAANQALQRMGI